MEVKTEQVSGTAPESGTIWMRPDPDQDFRPRNTKAGDVGMDLPVKIDIDMAKFGESPDRLRFAMTIPSLVELLRPEGSIEDRRPHMLIPPHGWAEIPSGLSVKLPDDAWGMVTTRSSTAWCKKLIVINGVIDTGYIGLLGTLVHNPNADFVKVIEYDSGKRQGDLLSQLILIPRYEVDTVIMTQRLPKTDRGKSGFGSTDVN